MKPGTQAAQNQNLQAQWIVCVTAVVLFGIKISAWAFTHSVAILTDALESTVNVISGFLGLYSLYVSRRPRDADHPYGHGKVEFISAAVEGTLIVVAGGVIVYEAVLNIWEPHSLQKLDTGIILVAIAGGVNWIVGTYAGRLGKRNKSLALQASGRHLLSDTWSTVGILVGLFLILWSGIQWLDSATAILFAGLIIVQGIGIVRRSVAGIMDETDEQLLEEVVEWLQTHRENRWIDLHNLRIIKYGAVLHLDAHLTVPWYLNVHEAHAEIDRLQATVTQAFGESVELFVHTDGCLDFSCRICGIADCPERKHPLDSLQKWTIENLRANEKHGKWQK
ncbi:MAG: cation transporter [Bacteroidetes bacterium]|nr:cation transporter [Bacteroidota bacterium]